MSSFGTCNHLNEFKVVFDQKKAIQFCQNFVFHKVSERQALLGLFAANCGDPCNTDIIMEEKKETCSNHDKIQIYNIFSLGTKILHKVKSSKPMIAVQFLLNIR